MNQELIKAFKNDKFGNIRVVLVGVNQEPYFVGKDVALSLGYKDPADAVKKHVDEDDKGVGELPTPGGIQKMTCINESGLYSLILGSKLPSAKEFKRWVTSEVLPTIRQTGGYGNPYGHLSKELQAIIMVDQKQQELDNRITKLEDTMVIDYSKQEIARSLIAARVIALLGGDDSAAYRNKTVSQKTFRSIHRAIHKEFQVNSYKNTAHKDFERLRAYISTWMPNEELKLMILGANAQMRL